MQNIMNLIALPLFFGVVFMARADNGYASTIFLKMTRLISGDDEYLRIALALGLLPHVCRSRSNIVTRQIETGLSHGVPLELYRLKLPPFFGQLLSKESAGLRRPVATADTGRERSPGNGSTTETAFEVV